MHFDDMTDNREQEATDYVDSFGIFAVTEYIIPDGRRFNTYEDAKREVLRERLTSVAANRPVLELLEDPKFLELAYEYGTTTTAEEKLEQEPSLFKDDI